MVVVPGLCVRPDSSRCVLGMYAVFVYLLASVKLVLKRTFFEKYNGVKTISALESPVK